MSASLLQHLRDPCIKRKDCNVGQTSTPPTVSVPAQLRTKQEQDGKRTHVACFFPFETPLTGHRRSLTQDQTFLDSLREPQNVVARVTAASQNLLLPAWAASTKKKKSNNWLSRLQLSQGGAVSAVARRQACDLQRGKKGSKWVATHHYPRVFCELPYRGGGRRRGEEKR